MGEALAEKRLMGELDAVATQLGLVFCARFREVEAMLGEVGEEVWGQLVEENQKRVERVEGMRRMVVEKARLREELEGVW